MHTEISALAKRLGVNRLANLTGLDRLGIPVFAAIRPLSRNLTVSFGKGLTHEQAQCSAVMEAAELFFSEKPCNPLLVASFDELPKQSALDPSLLQRDDSAGDLGDVTLEWMEGQDLLTGKPMLVPWQALSMDYSVEARLKPSKLKYGATGLAAGFDETSAILHGIYEVIERGCHNAWNELDDEPRIATLVDQRSLNDETIISLLKAVKAADLDILIWDMSDHRCIPCYLAEIVDLKPHAATAFSQGAAASLSSVTALQKALLEAIQIRLTYIAGSRDDLDWSDYGTRYDDVVESRRWLLGNVVARRAMHAGEAESVGSQGELTEMLQRLSAEEHSQAVVVWLSPPSEDIAVVKVIIPDVSDIPEADYYANLRRKHLPEFA